MHISRVEKTQYSRICWDVLLCRRRLVEDINDDGNDDHLRIL